MAWQDAVQAVPGGVRLLLEVTPGARTPAFPAGFNAWRGRIQARVRAPAQDGKANEEVVAAVAAALGCSRDAVAIVAGAGDRRKAVDVRDADREDVLARLAATLE